ncbi:metallopeptidase TldD-related protein [Micromonospora sp. CPCC 205546]|uniref:metallopeptidase TldD-related protein n=1 Tax=Micromonospora sp. CPCC 205546 TaxID=3122397 RepID=UPI002FF20DD6
MTSSTALVEVAALTRVEVEARREAQYEQLFQQWTSHVQACYAGGLRQAAVRLDAGAGRLRVVDGRARYAAADHARARAGGLLESAGAGTEDFTDLLAMRAASAAADLPVSLPGEHGLVEVHVVVDVYSTLHVVADTEGRCDASERVRCRTTVTAHAADLARQVSSRFVRSTTPTEDDLTSFARDTVRMLSRAPAASGEPGSRRTAMVLRPTAGAALLHELVGHACEHDNAYNGSPYARALRDAALSTPSLTIRDDPGAAHGYGSMTADDDGVPCGGRSMVEAGQFVGTLASVRCGASGGNGRRANYRFPTQPRATNTVVSSGGDPAESLYSTDSGDLLVVRSFSSGQVNPYTGHFDFTASGCELWSADGDRTYLGDVRLDGDALEVLRRLEAIGDDPAYESISCGKQGQWVGVGISSPSMRFVDISWTSAVTA